MAQPLKQTKRSLVFNLEKSHQHFAQFENDKRLCPSKQNDRKSAIASLLLAIGIARNTQARYKSTLSNVFLKLIFDVVKIYTY